MDSVTVHTVKDLKNDSELPRKRKYTSKACSSCRKLKIRCKELKTSSGSLSCEHCSQTQNNCSWPEEDGRKLRRARSPPLCSPSANATSQSGRASRPNANTITEPRTRQSPEEFIEQPATTDQRGDISKDTMSCSPASQTPHTVLQYYRYLGPTAIAPGYKKISLKITNDSSSSDSQNLRGCESNEHHDTSVFDLHGALPRAELLPHLLDAFFDHYGSYFCFLNRHQLENLISTDEISTFLLCSIAALAARFCNPDIFTPYFPPPAASQVRERWEYSLPFLNRAKTLLMPLLSIPSHDLVAGLLFLALAEFGDNNEAGMWMFTGMSTRVAQELGLHRKKPATYTSIGRSPINEASSNVSDTARIAQRPASVDLQAFENSSQIILWWCVFVQDTSLANGTGRVPSIKRSEISISLPTDYDVANVKAGPGGILINSEANVFPHMVRLMLEYSRSVEFLNTNHQVADDLTLRDQRLDTVETVREKILASYGTVPETLTCGAKQYRFASDSGQAIPYLLLHLNFHLQIAFLTQASHACEQEYPSSNLNRQHRGGQVSTAEPVDHNRRDSWTNENELYRKAIKSIVHMLTIARFVDTRPILSIFFLNQAFFHAACAYAGDMLRFQGHNSQQFWPEEESPAFPLPTRSSTSVVVDMDEIGRSSPHTSSSTDAYLALLAKSNYQFLRQAIKDMAKYYAGAGWVDAVLDQRESGIRDVDLSIVSESISTYIRLHDLRRGHHAPSKADGNQDLSGSAVPLTDEVLFSEDLLSGIFPDFDSEAFFNDYIFTGQYESRSMHALART